jgi:transitional endoplasmic reticulum ATPase
MMPAPFDLQAGHLLVAILALLALALFGVLAQREWRERRQYRAAVRKFLDEDHALKREIAQGLVDTANALANAGGDRSGEIQGLARSGWRWTSPRHSRAEIVGLPADVNKQIDTLVAMVREGERFRRLGVRPPNGVLITGPPGVGKTLLAHALAQEIGRSELLCVSGAMLLGPLVGLSAMRLRNLFEEARKQAPAVVFLDELDVLGSRRRQRVSGADAEAHTLISHLIEEMDQLGDSGVLVLAATHRSDQLDPALLRLGRFESQLHLDLPDTSGREQILRFHAAGKPLSEADLAGVAAATGGFSGADLVAVFQVAGQQAGMDKRDRIVADPDLVNAQRRVRQLLLQRSANEREEGFGRSPAQLFDNGRPPVRFADVGGLAKAKESLSTIVDFLRRPALYRESGCRVPKGVLLSGPPGVGKTMLARAVAGEAGVPFFYASGSDFAEMYVGVAAARVRDLFRIVRRQSPALLFVDELDALARTRSADARSSAEHAHAVNQLLVELDGFDQDESVVLIAATNRADTLDPALLRSGRLEDVVEIGLPEAADRRAILQLYLGERHTLALPGDLESLVQQTTRMSGADLERLINTARIHSVQKDRRGRIGWEDLYAALLRNRRPAALQHPT